MNKRRKIISTICFALSAAFLLAIGICYYCYYQDDMALKQVKDLVEETDMEHSDSMSSMVQADNGDVLQQKYIKVFEENEDFVGWITIDGTTIDYPVMWTPKDEQKYLHKGFDGDYSFAGTIFASANSSFHPESDNILLYGHHLNYVSMFTELLKYEEQDFFEQHRYITFNTIYQNATYEVVYAGRTQVYPDDYQGFVYWEFQDAENKAEFDEYVDEMKAISSISNEDTEIKYGDKLLTLSTCAYHTKGGRFVVVAKKITS